MYYPLPPSQLRASLSSLPDLSSRVSATVSHLPSDAFPDRGGLERAATAFCHKLYAADRYTPSPGTSLGAHTAVVLLHAQTGREETRGIGADYGLAEVRRCLSANLCFCLSARWVFLRASLRILS